MALHLQQKESLIRRYSTMYPQCVIIRIVNCGNRSSIELKFKFLLDIFLDNYE